MRILRLLLFSSVVLCTACTGNRESFPAVVLQTDFGTKDGAVAAMKGVARSVDPRVDIIDLTHEIPAYNTWEAAWRLSQTAAYWPPGTIFVSVVDPGVGTTRKSIVLKTRSGHFFVGPDNGSFGLVAAQLGVEAVREIDEAINRRASSQGSYTFHGRDVYAYTAARLAAGSISFEEAGKRLADTVMSIPHVSAHLDGDSLFGMIPVLDIQYGNVWTNIPDSLVRSLGAGYGDTVAITIRHGAVVHFRGRVPLKATFAEVPPGQLLTYYNSLMQLSFAMNQGSLADSFGIQSGPGWGVVISR
jgi:S-adenosylmethionine hydrolase